VPDSGKGKNGIVFQREAVWLPQFGQLFPFVEAVSRNQTSAELERVAKGRRGGGRFRARVDRPGADGRVLGPVGNQAPAHQGELARGTRGVLPHGGNLVGGRDVIARRPLHVVVSAEVFLQRLATFAQPEASAHKNSVCHY